MGLRARTLPEKSTWLILIERHCLQGGTSACQRSRRLWPSATVRDQRTKTRTVACSSEIQQGRFGDVHPAVADGPSHVTKEAQRVNLSNELISTLGIDDPSLVRIHIRGHPFCHGLLW